MLTIQFWYLNKFQIQCISVGGRKQQRNNMKSSTQFTTVSQHEILQTQVRELSANIFQESKSLHSMNHSRNDVEQQRSPTSPSSNNSDIRPVSQHGKNLINTVQSFMTSIPGDEFHEDRVSVNFCVSVTLSKNLTWRDRGIDCLFTSTPSGCLDEGCAKEPQGFISQCYLFFLFTLSLLEECHHARFTSKSDPAVARTCYLLIKKPAT